MSEENNKSEKTCWACKRTFEGRSILGLCPECVNKAGSTVAGIGIIALSIVTGKNIKKK